MDSSPSQKNIPLQRIKVAVFLFAIVVALGAIGFAYFRSSSQTPVSTTPPSPVVNQTITEGLAPVKTEFGTKAPEDFPTNIPLESGVVLNQSYRLDYPGQKQLTAVFASKETIKKNYDRYAEFLKESTWTVSNTYEGKTIASLYALKGNDEMNVTVSADEGTGSLVSISVLKK